MSLTPVCNGNLTNDALTQTVKCDVSWTSQNVVVPFDISTLDPVVIVQAFTAGALLVFPAFAIAWGAAFVVRSIGGNHG